MKYAVRFNVQYPDTANNTQDFFGVYYGDIAPLHDTQAAADEACKILNTSGDWDGEDDPYYFVEEVGDDFNAASPFELWDLR